MSNVILFAECVCVCVIRGKVCNDDADVNDDTNIHFISIVCVLNMQCIFQTINLITNTVRTHAHTHFD